MKRSEFKRLKVGDMVETYIDEKDVAFDLHVIEKVTDTHPYSLDEGVTIDLVSIFLYPDNKMGEMGAIINISSNAVLDQFIRIVSKEEVLFLNL